ncbi:MAG: hypothetical protein ACXW1P_02710 [Methylophilaceae bacterium]
MANGMMEANTITISIATSATNVYEFTANPENLPQWSPTLCQSISQADGEWIAESPLGPATVIFVQSNPFGVLDHMVRMSSSLEIYNAMRVIPNGTGSEVIFTIFQTASMSDEQFSENAAHVQSDLNMLKAAIEALYTDSQ